MSPKKKGKDYCLFAFGSKEMKGMSKRSVWSALRKAITPDLENLAYIVVGNNRDTEKVVQGFCRHWHIPFVLVPADYEKFSYNADHLRNGLALKFFKPTKVVIIHKDPEEESSVKAVISWAKNHKAEVIYVGNKDLPSGKEKQKNSSATKKK